MDGKAVIGYTTVGLEYQGDGTRGRGDGTEVGGCGDTVVIPQICSTGTSTVVNSQIVVCTFCVGNTADGNQCTAVSRHNDERGSLVA